MDKYEYKLRAEEMKDLIGRKEYAEAMAIADTIDWRRVKNVTMLTMVSDLYKINRRYDASRDMLLLAYDRYPGGRTIVYSLCELSIKLGEFVQAVEYYKEFVRVAPSDSGRYILKYKIYDAQEVSLEERIRVLEEFKEIDYREKWGYELAFLYHRAGLERQCVAECDELIITFGEGKYVIKAMELKMLHQPLTPVQQERYDNRNNKKNVMEAPSARQKASLSAKPQEDERYAQSPNGASERQGMTEIGHQGAAAPGSDTDMDIHVRTLDLGNKYNTLNIQAALADSMKELMAKDALEAEAQRKQQARERARQAEQSRLAAEQARLEQERLERERLEQERLEQERLEQARLEQERLEQERLERERLEQERLEQERLEQARLERERLEQARLEQARLEQARLEQARLEQESRAQKHAAQEDRALTFDPNSMDAASIVQNMAERAALNADSRYDEILAMENDGQISLVVPEQSRVEKQITGQLSIEEVLREWERMKRASDQKSMDNLKQRVLQQTGEMFTAFDKSTKSGLLEGLEDENSSLSHLPIQPEEPKPRPKTEAEVFTDSVLKDEGLEGEDLPEVEELIEIDDYSETGELDSAGIAASAEEMPQDKEPEAEIAQKTSDIEYVVDTGMMQTIMGVSETSNKEEAPAQEQQPDGDTQRLEAAIIEAEMEERNAIRQSEEKARADRAAQKPVPENDGFNTREIMSVSDKLIENAEREVRGESEKEQTPARALTEDEKELFGALIQTDQMKHQIAAAIDKVSLAAYTGNVIITGENGSGTMTLAKNLIKNVQISDSNFSGRIARISGAALDKKDIPATLSKLRNGALIVEKANGMSADSLKKLTQYLEQEHEGIIVILEDTKIEMRKCLNKNPSLEENFNARIDINAMDNDALVAYAKEYAYEKEYSIDDLGVLALYTRISDIQTGDHNVTLGEVREIMDEAIWSANRKSPKHFVDILSGKRYDNEDMIVLREKDFIC